MQAELHIDDDGWVTQWAERIGGIAEEPAARRAYREAFGRLRSQLSMYPTCAPRASAVFESAARSVRLLAAPCLPLAIALAMHLYPLCVLQCVPLPLFSAARFKRAMLLRSIRNRALILANAGSERAQGADHPLTASQAADGIRIDGTCEYMSLASVADLVLFRAKLADGNGTVLCAADLRADSVQIGTWKFGGSMRLSDTSSVTFTGHRVPHGRYLLVPDDAAMQWVADYQRCWFHLFVAELYLARLERLHDLWELPRTAEHTVSLSEVSQLKAHSLQLLDSFSSSADIASLLKSTSTLKLRVSRMAQSTAASLRSLEPSTAADALRLAADATELGYIRLQPTSDEKILSSLGAARG
jgi:hypothetical protein